MFIAAFFTIAKRWKQPKCPSIDEKIKYDVDARSRILFSLKEEGSSDICYNMNMNLEDLMLNEISQSKRTDTGCFHLYEVPRVVKFIETESRRVAARAWGEGERGWYRVCT